MNTWAISYVDDGSYEPRFASYPTERAALDAATIAVESGNTEVVVWRAHKIGKRAAQFEDPA